MFQFLVIVQALVGAAMIGLILMQKSEGGGLGVGGSPSGLMSARGAADLLTRGTAVLAGLFVVLSIILAGLASVNHSTGQIGDSLSAPAKPVGTAPGPLGGTPTASTDPLVNAANQGAAARGNEAAPATGVPIE